MQKLSRFTQKVLKTTSQIPFGKTLSYSEVAKLSGSSKGARAVGSALNRNPFPVLIPCHRVVSKTGAVGGFSAGTQIKKKLLKLEGIDIS